MDGKRDESGKREGGGWSWNWVQSWGEGGGGVQRKMWLHVNYVRATKWVIK